MLLTCDLNKRKSASVLKGIDADFPDDELGHRTVRTIFEVLLRTEKAVSVRALCKILTDFDSKLNTGLINSCMVSCISLMDVELKKIRGVYYLGLRSDLNERVDVADIIRNLRHDTLRTPSVTASNTIDMNYRYLSSLVKLLNIVEKVSLIVSTGKEITRSEVVSMFKLSAREYKKFTDLYSNVSTSMVLKRSGLNLSSVPKMKAIIREDLRNFKLSDENFQKIRKYSQKFQESDEHTLNRVIREFFFIQEQTKRLRRPRG